jgi:hypothetical protein
VTIHRQRVSSTIEVRGYRHLAWLYRYLKEIRNGIPGMEWEVEDEISRKGKQDVRRMTEGRKDLIERIEQHVLLRELLSSDMLSNW